MIPHSFGSDNASGAHPDVLAAVLAANTGHTPAYGADPWTRRAEALLAEQFGPGTRAFLVLNGTGANVASLAALLRPHHAVVCSAEAHVLVNECGALARATGSSVLPVPTDDGLLTRDALDRVVRPGGGVHRAVPAVLSLTNASELGTAYLPDHVADLARWAHDHDMAVQVDGARLANAAAAAGCTLAELSMAAGVDVVTFGGTKNGLLFGDAVVFADSPAGRAAAREFGHVRMQTTQLVSKMRFVAAQFVALLESGLWLRTATAANAAAARLGDGLATVPGVGLRHPVQTNAVFATMPPALAGPLSQEFGFHTWDARAHVVRLICSFDTGQCDVDNLVRRAQQLVPKRPEVKPRRPAAPSPPVGAVRAAAAAPPAGRATRAATPSPPARPPPRPARCVPCGLPTSCGPSWRSSPTTASTRCGCCSPPPVSDAPKPPALESPTSTFERGPSH